MEKNPKVAAIIGDVNIDIITPPFDPRVLQEGETSCVLDEFTTSLGGNAINAAATLASLQAPHVFIGGLGDCAISNWIKETCEKLKINTKFSILKGKNAGITFALTYEDGKRQFVATLGTNKIIKREDLDLSIISEIGQNLHLHRAGFWYTTKLKGTPTIEMFKQVIKNGGETSLDVGWDPENFTDENREILYQTLNFTSFFFGNEKEFKAITKKEDIEQAYEELLAISTEIENPYLIVHRGDQGCSIISRKERFDIPAFLISKVINPTGSGDVFNGAFIYGLLQNWTLQETGKFAGKAAAVHLGDISKIYPTLSDIQELTT